MTSGGGLITQTVRRPVSSDAVVVIPGIMGSALRAGDRELWGLQKLGWYGRAWRSKASSLDELALTAEERRGVYDRVTPDGLLRFPAFAPVLQGFEPYHALTKAVSAAVADPAAVLEFGYDWRLPVEHNAARLAERARAHLTSWHEHPIYRALRRDLPDSPPARLVLVAHSMGGLLARALPGGLDVRATVTLGTPFDGAAKAVLLLRDGSGGSIPLPRRTLSRAARTMPGVYDLLPFYRCVDDRVGDTDPRVLTAHDVVAFGGERELAERAFASHHALANRPLPGEHVALIGIGQPTVTSLTLTGATVEAHRHTFRLRHGVFARDADGVLVRYREDGDGTVPLNSALPRGMRPAMLPQAHGAVAATGEAIDAVREVIAGRDPYAERLGGGDLGLDLPDLVPAGTEVTIAVTGVDGPTDAVVTVEDSEGVTVDEPALHHADRRWCVTTTFPSPGVHRVTVAGSGTTPVVQLTLADTG